MQTPKQLTETLGGLNVLLFKKRFRDNETGEARFGSYGKRDRLRLTQREEQNRRMFTSPSRSSIPSCSISISFLLSHFLSSIVLSLKSCHDKPVYFKWLTFHPVPLAWKNTPGWMRSDFQSNILLLASVSPFEYSLRAGKHSACARTGAHTQAQGCI